MKRTSVLILIPCLALPVAAHADLAPRPVPACTLEAPAASGRACMVCRHSPDVPGWCQDAERVVGWESICSEADDGYTREVWCRVAEGSQAPIESPPILHVPAPGESDASGDRAAAAAAATAVEASGDASATAADSSATAAASAPTAGVAVVDERGCASAGARTPASSILPAFAAFAALLARRRSRS